MLRWLLGVGQGSILVSAHVTRHPCAPIRSERDGEEIEREKAQNFERDQLRKLVNDELKRYGLLMVRRVVPKGHGWRTKENTHVLYGQVIGQASGFPTREILAEGEFRDCCIRAAELLDALDKSQVPDTATGND